MQQRQQPRQQYGTYEPYEPNTSTPQPAVMPAMDQIAGYQAVGVGLSIVAPPPGCSEEVTRPNVSQECYRPGVQITAEEAKERLVQYAQSQCCWGTSAAESMAITSIQSSSAIHYILRTYLETRATDWVHEPFRGQCIDGPEHGVPPLPWDINVQNPQFFTDKTINVEVPHTASVKTCHECNGSHYVPCKSCCCRGRTNCTSCSGSGRDDGRRCVWCDGTGHRQCIRCQGHGKISCEHCEATGRLKCYIRLTVEFKTHQNDFVLKRTALPEERIRGVRGATLLEDTQPRLQPIRSFPDPEVNRASESLVLQHSQLAQSGRIWMQSHVIRGVPVTVCDGNSDGARLRFLVYGMERKVYAPDYPQQCCGGCQLL